MAAMLKSLLSNLDLSQPDIHDKILSAAQLALSIKTDDRPTSQAAHVVALLNLERYADVVVLLDSDPAAATGLEFEFGYALYRTDKLDQARKLLESARDALGRQPGSQDRSRERGIAHLLAQVYYRQERFVDSANLYTGLSSRSLPGQNEGDVAVNVDAVLAQLAFSAGDAGLAADRIRSGRPQYSSFETIFNQACRAIGRGELVHAASLLRKAREACESSGLKDQDLDAELQPILAQQLYVALELKQTDRISEFAAAITPERISDGPTRQFAMLNKALANFAVSDEPANPFLVQRQIQDISRASPAGNPFKFQIRAKRQNELAVRLSASKQEGLQRALAPKQEKTDVWSNSETEITDAVALAASNVVGQDEKTALKTLARLANGGSGSQQIGLALAYAQQLVQAGRLGQAAGVIDQLARQLLSADSADATALLAHAGILSLVLGFDQVRKTSIDARLPTLRAVVKFWLSDHPSGVVARDTVPVSLFLSVGSALLQSGLRSDLELGLDLFTTLSSAAPAEQLFQTGSAAASAALSAHSPDSIIPDDSDLADLTTLIGSVDVDELERIGIPASTSNVPSSNPDLISLIASLSFSPASSEVNTGKRSRSSAKPQYHRRKRVRLSRMAKNIEPGSKPDPERWLPLEDRSYFKPKGKKGKGRAGGETTQGADVATVAISPSGTSTPTPAPASKGKKGKRGKR